MPRSPTSRASTADAKQCFDADAAFANRARDYVVRLQSGDAHCRACGSASSTSRWRTAREIYRKLNVTLRHADIKAESATTTTCRW